MTLLVPLLVCVYWTEAQQADVNVKKDGQALDVIHARKVIMDQNVKVCDASLIRPVPGHPM